MAQSIRILVTARAPYHLRQIFVFLEMFGPGQPGGLETAASRDAARAEDVVITWGASRPRTF